LRITWLPIAELRFPGSRQRGQRRRRRMMAQG
jgi:hypothetical protein